MRERENKLYEDRSSEQERESKRFNRKMSGIKHAVHLLGTLWALSRGDFLDAEVSCDYMKRCTLPCSFQNDTDLVIHWNKAEDTVHSFYYDDDQLAFQHQHFTNRTSLFKDQIRRGDASLHLTGVKIQDEGRYKCYIGTMNNQRESYVNLRVEAPVHKVNLEQVENRITCSSEGIYPQPKLTWSTSPPSNETLKKTTEVQRTEQLLYNIRSSLILPDSDADLSYSCNISTGRSRRRATLFKPTSISGSHTEATIPCVESNTSFKSLVWRFNRSQIILTQTRGDVLYTVSERWRHQVEAVSESGSLKLQNLSSYHEGTYTCELSDAEETLITNTYVWIEEGPDVDLTIIIVSVVAALVVLAMVIGLGLVLDLYCNDKICLSDDQRQVETSRAETQISQHNVI